MEAGQRDRKRSFPKSCDYYLFRCWIITSKTNANWQPNMACSLERVWDLWDMLHVCVVVLHRYCIK